MPQDRGLKGRGVILDPTVDVSTFFGFCLMLAEHKPQKRLKRLRWSLLVRLIGPFLGVWLIEYCLFY